MSEYAIVAPEDFDQSAFRLIGKDWMLVTAKNEEGRINTMTASWGGFGGFGYLPGAILGGLCIGIVENIASMVLPSVYKDIVAFVLLVGFLLIRPAGITGKTR